MPLSVDLDLVPPGVHGAAGEHAYEGEGEGHGQAAVGVHATDGLNATAGEGHTADGLQVLEGGNLHNQMQTLAADGLPDVNGAHTGVGGHAPVEKDGGQVGGLDGGLAEAATSSANSHCGQVQSSVFVLRELLKP